METINAHSPEFNIQNPKSSAIKPSHNQILAKFNTHSSILYQSHQQKITPSSINIYMCTYRERREGEIEGRVEREREREREEGRVGERGREGEREGGREREEWGEGEREREGLPLGG